MGRAKLLKFALPGGGAKLLKCGGPLKSSTPGQPPAPRRSVARLARAGLPGAGALYALERGACAAQVPVRKGKLWCQCLSAAHASNPRGFTAFTIPRTPFVQPTEVCRMVVNQ